jgi:uncharacterized surface anchored protein
VRSKVTKLSSKDNSALAGAKFTVKDGDGNTVPGGSLTTGGDGTACVDNLPFGSYTVKETDAPAGYAIDNGDAVSVTVDRVASCTSGTPNAPAAFTDTPLSEIQVKFTSLAGAGVTKASIVCEHPVGTAVSPVSENGSADLARDDADETFTSLKPGVYTCTVDVDP